MRQNAEVVIVTQKAIRKAPVAIQKFVERFFEKKIVLGINCWAAFEELSVSGKEKGVAPCHHVDVRYLLNEYGKTKGEELYEHWQAIKKDPKQSFIFCGDWDDGCSGPPVNDD